MYTMCITFTVFFPANSKSVPASRNGTSRPQYPDPLVKGVADHIAERNDGERKKQKIVVTGAFPEDKKESGALTETIRDPVNTARLMFLRWENGSATIFHSIDRAGRIYLPPDPSSRSFPALSLPNGLLPCGNPAEMLAEICCTISRFIRLRHDHLRIVGIFVLASWFPDCFEAAPYLWVVGPLGSGKTKLLVLLGCLCRRGLIAGDLRSGSLYKLTATWDPTLVIDELEPGSSGAHAELRRLLRAGSVPGVPTFRNGQRFSNYGMKVIASRQPLGDTALLSRGVIVSLLPADDDLLPLDESASQQIAEEFQAKLLTFRLKNHPAVKNFRTPSNAMLGLSPRTKQIAQALAAPLLGDPENTAELLAILGESDEEARIERSLEPEWLITEDLFDLVHKREKGGDRTTNILIGGVAAYVNRRMQNQGEDIRLSAKRAGAVVKGLGLRTGRLGRWGRGLKMTSSLKRKIHEIAQQLGIDRRTIAPLAAVEAGYGGAPCSLCEELGLTGGLHFDRITEFPQRKARMSRRGSLFNHPDNEEVTRPPGQESDDKVS